VSLFRLGYGKSNLYCACCTSPSLGNGLQSFLLAPIESVSLDIGNYRDEKNYKRRLNGLKKRLLIEVMALIFLGIWLCFQFDEFCLLFC
jgi:hypothetical protein